MYVKREVGDGISYKGLFKALPYFSALLLLFPYVDATSRSSQHDVAVM